MVLARLIALIQALHRCTLYAFPPSFRSRFGEEMAEVLSERLATAEEEGARAVVSLGAREFWQMPAALVRLYLYRWKKKGRRIRAFVSQVRAQPVFGVPPVADDGRFSTGQLLLEVVPFLLAAIPIAWLTYRPLPWLPDAGRTPVDAAVFWSGIPPALALTVGLVRGMPRWAYPHAGLLGGYTLWLAAERRQIWLWVTLLTMVVGLSVMAAVVHERGRPLPPFFRRLGGSVGLDWTRLSLGVFGAAPWLILAAFDNAYLDGRTPYLGLALLAMVLTVVVYGRRGRQERQLAALLGGATLLMVPAVMDHVYWLGSLRAVGWIVVLCVWAVALLVLPMLVVPVQWASNLAPLGSGEE